MTQTFKRGDLVVFETTLLRVVRDSNENGFTLCEAFEGSHPFETSTLEKWEDTEEQQAKVTNLMDLVGPGFPATLCHIIDEYAMEVVSTTPSKKTIMARFASQHRQGEVRKFTLRKNGKYHQTGGYGHLHLGSARDYRCREI